MTDVIPKETKYVRLRYTKPLSAYASVDFGDIDLSQVAKIEAVKWCTLMLTMKDGSKEYVETNISDEASKPYFQYGFVLCGLLDEDWNTLQDVSTEEE